MKSHLNNPFYRDPDHPHFNRRAYHHDYTRPARYLITILKRPDLPPFSSIEGNPFSKEKNAIRVKLSPSAAGIPEAISRWQHKFPINAKEYVVMPDHIHICADVYAPLPNNFSRAVANLMGMISKSIWLSVPEPKRPAELSPAFSKGFNDRIAYTDEQWHRQLQYIADNPRRYLIKKLFPDYLLKRWVMKMSDGRKFALRGNIFLLKQPYLFRVKTSRSYSQVEAAAAMADWQRQLHNGAIPVSPFIHPHEKAFRDFAIENGFSFIRICDNGFAERGAPGGKEFELMASGRLLHIASIEFSSQKIDMKYSFAQQLNQLSLEIVNICNSGQPMTIREEN